MVGLYYKRREERSQHKYLNLIGKCFLGFAGLVLIGVIFVVFFFNGERVKGPVSVYLSAKLDSPVTIGSADFSPLYPDVMRLSDVRFGGTRINELYVEYELSSLFSNKALILNDLYINGLSLSEADIEKFKLNRFKHESISIETLRLNHIPLNFEGLSSKDLNLRLRDVVYNDQGLTFIQGNLSALDASLYGEKVSNLSVEFKTSNQGYLLSNLSVNMLGGTISGTGMFYPNFTDQDHNAALQTTANSTRTFSAASLLQDKLGLDVSLLNFSLISAAHASEESSATATTNATTANTATTNNLTATAPANATTNTNDTTAATTTSAPSSAPIHNEIQATAQNNQPVTPRKATQDITVEAKNTVATNTFMAIPSPIENSFNAVGEKTQNSKEADSKPINQGFMGLTNNQDPCAYQQVMSSMQPSAGHLDFDELYLTKLVLPRCIIMPGNFAVTAKTATLSDVIITNQSNTGIKTGFLDAKKNQEQIINDIATIDENTKVVDKTEQDSEDAKKTNYADFVIQGINGHINDLKVEQGKILGSFVGTVSEISFPNLQTVLEQSRSSISFNENGLKFELKGNVYEGTYQVRGNYDKNQSLLTLSDLRLASNKLELTKPRWNFLQQSLSTYQVKLRALSFDKLEFLSYINDFPVSVQSISGNATNWQFNNPQRKRYVPSNDNDLRTTLQENRKLAQGDGPVREATDPYSTLSFNIEGDPKAMLNINLTNTLYSDLLMRKAQIVVSLADDILNISVPKLHFNESELSAQASIGLVDKNANSYFTVTAENFEIADLNSNLINHLLTGKVNLSLDLSSQYNELDEMWQNLEGKVKVTSDALLISDLGIDLINGGPKKDYKLTGTELMTAVQGSVAGVNNLNVDINFGGHEAKVNGQMGLATSNTVFEGQLDLLESKTVGMANLVSLAQDSATQVVLSGSLDEPVFDIVALKRGEQRPGLYLPQYEASAIAKEQTDASRKHFTDVKTEDQAADSTGPTETTAATEPTKDSSTAEQGEQGEPKEQADSSAQAASEQAAPQAPVASEDSVVNTAENSAENSDDAQTNPESAQGSNENAQPSTEDNANASSQSLAPNSSEQETPEKGEASQTEQGANSEQTKDTEQAQPTQSEQAPALETSQNGESVSTESGANDDSTELDSSTPARQKSPEAESNGSEQAVATPKNADNAVNAVNAENAEEDVQIEQQESASTDATQPSAEDNANASAEVTPESSVAGGEKSEEGGNESAELQSETAVANAENAENAKSVASTESDSVAQGETAATQEGANAESTAEPQSTNKLTDTSATTSNEQAQDNTAESSANTSSETTELADSSSQTTAPAPETTASSTESSGGAETSEVVANSEQVEQETNLTAESTNAMETADQTQETTQTQLADKSTAQDESSEAEAMTPEGEQTEQTASTEQDATATEQEPTTEVETVANAEQVSEANEESDTAETSSTETQVASSIESVDHAQAQEETPEVAQETAQEEVGKTTPESTEAPEQTSAEQEVAIAEQNANAKEAKPETLEPASTEPTKVTANTEHPQTTNETIASSQQLTNDQAQQTTKMELKPSDSVQLSKPEDKPVQEQGSNVSIAESQTQSPEQKQAEMEKQADDIENNLLEQAAFDSFFSFDGFFGDEGEAEDSESKEQSAEQGSDDYSFNNQDDEMIF